MARSTKTEWNVLEELQRVRLEREGLTIEAQLDVEREHLYLLTSVFEGGNYLPSSVRKCLHERGLRAYDRGRTITLSIDEAHYRVFLLIEAKASNTKTFNLVLKEFLALAHDWRHELQQRGTDDLIYIQAGE